jgi:predicted ABC-type transport system involved in lysophospholipase L1 biosynthesis ATPase subunit
MAPGTPRGPVHVTHDAEVGASCDRIIRMRDGRIVADERVTEVGLAA